MLARTRRGPILAAATALGLTAAAGAAGATGAAAATAPAASTTSTTARTATLMSANPGSATSVSPNRTPAAATTQTSTLPNGDRVTVTGTGPSASVTVTAPNGRSIPFTRYAPDAHHTYIIPASAAADPAQFVPAQYLVPALSTPAAPAATPFYPMVILQINALGLDGKAANAVTYLQNTDDGSKWNAPIPVVNGIARVAVPVGHYTATTGFTTYDSTGFTATQRLVTQLDFTVAAGGVTTLTADERTATSQVAAATPKPSAGDLQYLIYGRTDSKGVTGHLVVENSGSVYVAPTATAQIGTFSYQLAAWIGTNPAGSSDLYTYALAFPAADHIDPNQNYPVDTSKLTTTHNTIDTDAGDPVRKGEFMIGPYSPEYGGLTNTQVFPVPAHLTSYVSAPLGDMSWTQQAMTALPSPSSGSPSALLFGKLGGVYQGPDKEVWRTWGHGPITPQVGQYKDTAGLFSGPVQCNSCADGGTVDLALVPVQDSNPDSFAQLLGPANAHLTVYRDGTQVFSQDNASGTELTNQAQQPGTYRLVYDQDLSQFPITQSTSTHTDITVPYDPAAASASTLPSGYVCAAQGTGTTPCSILPVLDLNYQLATDDTNTSHGPVAALDLTVGHESYGSAGSQAAATGATVSVSFDKGVTWTAASVVPAGQNHFVALWKNNAPKGATPWLKVTATDALGGSISQTVDNAYTIG
ncbi:hypothetical protein KGQ20_34140 [Catenulispora sp. NF23]|uniref:hypothetical protein n=1 Tax=Catenulispora pinistramenti TaxID=2705254 RepID=UPI001BA989A0|nr:hypothetical protein [Catenulispora pinistramenti]MBS2537806.1 hypothetical protein [Catenulispora pinistramenti]